MASFRSLHGRAPVKSPFSAAVEAPNENDEDMLRRMNGHFFKGQKQDLQPHGEGEYTFKNGTVYTGSFSEGMFDGAGTLTFTDGARFVAQWRAGELVSGAYAFADALEYQPENWEYCTDADRRFWSEQRGGMLFAQRPQLTDSGEQDTASLPYATYDLGDCYLDPQDNKLYNYDVSNRERQWQEAEHQMRSVNSGTYYRDPTPEELTWAKRKARIGLDKPPAAKPSA